MIQRLINWYFRKFPPEMVSYWKYTDAVRAKVTKMPEGHYAMYMEGEKYPFPGFPRGSVLFGTLSKLKHEIKNQIFNETWRELDEGAASHEKVIAAVHEICKLSDSVRLNMLPPDKMAPAVQEIWRAWSIVEKLHKTETMRSLKEALCFILQEDDAYRFRFQWIAKYLRWLPVSKFIYALEMLEQAEMVDDMKGRVRLWRRVLAYMIEDPEINRLFRAFMKEVNWNKVKLTKADKYFFRAKYFKVDYPLYQY